MFKLILPMLSLLLINQNTSPKWTGTSMFILTLGTYSLMFVFQPLISHFSPTEFFSISNISAPLISLTIWISALMIIASFKTLHTAQSPSTFSFNIVILCLILTLTFSVNSLPLFYISFEASLIPTLILILGWGYQPERLQASMYLMLYTITASLPLLLAICISHSSNNHSSFLLPSIAPLQNSAGAIWWFACMAAFLVKMPMYTTHLWLPKAHVEAPVAGSMILAGILLKLGGYGLMQMMIMFPSVSSFLPSLIVAISMWGAVATAMICLRQTDMKSLIAYSSVGHMGLLTAGLMSNSTWGWNGAMIMMLAHGLCSPAMFALANMTYEATKTRSMYLSKGLLMLFPSLSFWWFIMSAANMAAPPSINLFGEIVLFPSILAQAPQMGLLLALSTFLAGAYSLFLYTSSQHGAPPSFSNPTHLFTTRNYYVILLHAFPLFLLILKAELVTLF